MRHIAHSELTNADGVHASGAPGLDLTWIQGPTTNDELDVGVVKVAAGAQTPPHSHHKGQVIVGLAGRGFVEHEGVRVVVEPGDVVLCAAGEHHVHGAVHDQHWEHLTVSTGTHGGPRSE